MRPEISSYLNSRVGKTKNNHHNKTFEVFFLQGQRDYTFNERVHRRLFFADRCNSRLCSGLFIFEPVR
jgi:hypothetical protein